MPRRTSLLSTGALALRIVVAGAGLGATAGLASQDEMSLIERAEIALDDDGTCEEETSLVREALPALVCPGVVVTDVRWLLSHPAHKSGKEPVARPPTPKRLEERVQIWQRIWGEIAPSRVLVVERSRPWRIDREIDCAGLTSASCQRRVDDARGEGEVAIRGKKGALDEALARAGDELAVSFAMFDLMRVPRAYAHLAVLESVWRAAAVSEKGALGAYQIMERTAERYLRVDDDVDERRDPVRASLAAAKYLKRLKAELGGWPEALTAYNTGPVRLRAVMRARKTRDLGRAIDGGDHGAFGFAGQNYYAQIEALARITDARAAATTAALADDDRAARIDRRIAFTELARCVGVDPDALARANPALSSAVVAGQRPVPKGYFARVPRDELSPSQRGPWPKSPPSSPSPSSSAAR